jgi:hypothetical protein
VLLILLLIRGARHHFESVNRGTGNNKKYDRHINMNVDRHFSRDRPMKRWIDCVKDDMRIKGVSMEMTSDRRDWKKKTCSVDLTYKETRIMNEK